MNDLFRTFNMYENIEPLSDEIKVFQCEEADETSSINSALSAMSLKSIANSRCNENLSTNDVIQQRLKRIHQMVASRKELKDTEQDVTPVSNVLSYFRRATKQLFIFRRVESNEMITMMMKKNMMKKKVGLVFFLNFELYFVLFALIRCAIVTENDRIST